MANVLVTKELHAVGHRVLSRQEKSSGSQRIPLSFGGDRAPTRQNKLLLKSQSWVA
jgi:hypothetical protein